LLRSATSSTALAMVVSPPSRWRHRNASMMLRSALQIPMGPDCPSVKSVAADVEGAGAGDACRYRW